jgi:hypothetical protein
MTPIPIPLRHKLSNDPYYKICARKNEDCDGRITWEHAFIYAGRQVQEEWAIIPLCVHHHLGTGLNKEINHLIALLRADLDDISARMPRFDWRKRLAYLESEYDYHP